MATVNILTAAKVLSLMGHVLVGAQVIGNDLVFTTLDGTTINVGNVRGPSSFNKIASTTPISPVSGVVATNVQAAIAELAADIANITSVKADPDDVTKLVSGTVTVNTVQYTLVSKVVTFPTGFFTGTPTVGVTLTSTVPKRVPYHSITDVSKTSFRLWTERENDNDTAYCWVAVE